MKKTKKNVDPIATARAQLGAALRSLLSTDQLARLAVYWKHESWDDERAGAAAAAGLADVVSKAEEAERNARERRVPLIGDRYATTLARGISDELARPRAGSWASVDRRDLERAYTIGSSPMLARHETHPGSRAGLIVVDLRDLDAFAGRDGKRSELTVLARVKGDPKP